MTSPIICFGQQPSGFFPKRFLVAKIQTARRLQKQIGGEIVFFYHDSDHDPRETRTTLRHRTTNEPAHLNFTFENKLQRKFSPLYAKRVPEGWKEKTILQLPNYVEHALINVFKEAEGDNVGDFCLDVYRRMGLMEGMTIVRSSSPEFRRAACDIEEYFVDVTLDGEIVRARHSLCALRLHEGGDQYINLPHAEYQKEQISASRDSRLKWMQSVIHCTHYVAGASEQQYLRKEDAPEIEYVVRDAIDRSEEAYVELE